ncbi:hypothetical protein CJ030_MR1G028874 [Morella rubra]|uniref:Phorbol-ester/DAG-type domain-containing protein n=1 Tax=Morella rubra TaxID=262757 RepID=A0A6A1WQN0_9ROSI|nr:hypothetical protein CJ030_MR1G028874 [Morella rubra]
MFLEEDKIKRTFENFNKQKHIRVLIVSSVFFLNNLHLVVNFIWNKDPFRRVLHFTVVIDLEVSDHLQLRFFHIFLFPFFEVHTSYKKLPICTCVGTNHGCIRDCLRERDAEVLIKEMEIEHFSHRHPLILTEVLETDGEKGVICSGCEESVLGPGYKCYECNFLLHKSCAELPREIQHPVHPNHTLTLRTSNNYASYCDACLKICRNCFTYKCNSCDFDLDIKCASRAELILTIVNNINMCSPIF